MKFHIKVNKLIYNDTFKIIATSRNQKQTNYYTSKIIQQNFP